MVAIWFGLMALLSFVAAQGQLTINTPTQLTTCTPALITFSGGQAPYFVSVLPGNNTAAAPLYRFPDRLPGPSVTWVVNLPANTVVTMQVTDNVGNINYSAQRTIIAGSDTSCVGQSASVSISSGASTTAGSSTTSGVSSTTSAPGSSTTAPPSSSATTPPSSSRSGTVAPSSAATSSVPGAGSITGVYLPYVLAAVGVAAVAVRA